MPDLETASGVRRVPLRPTAGPTGEDAVRLGSLSIDPALRRVAHDDGREEFLEPRVMHVLVTLLRAEGRVLTRDELLSTCWPNVLVGEDALNRVMGRLRRLAGGLGVGAFRIETITKVGYRLTAGDAEPVAPSTPSGVARTPSICVLPFTNMSDDPQQEYFSDGVSEDIITDLSKLSALFVVARNTAFAHRNQPVDVAKLASDLNVSHILEGSVRKAEGRVRITAQLIDGATGGHVWAERYDRELKDIFALQAEISQAIANALALKLLPEEKRAIEHRGTSDIEAYNLVLLARRYYDRGRDSDLRALQAIIRLCQRATEIDPGYARAWTLLGVGQTWLHFYYGHPGDSGESAIDRALMLDPGSAEAHAFKAKHLGGQGRYDAAFAEIATAIDLDPQSWAANAEGARLYYLQHRFEEAIGLWETASKLPDSAKTDAGMLISCYAAVGDRAGMRRAAEVALERAEEALTSDYVNGAALGCGVSALAVLGQVERARDMIRRALLIDPDNLRMRYNFACGAIMYLKDIETGLDLLAPAFQVMTADWLDYVSLDPDMESLRDDPRFKVMVAGATARLAAEQ